MIASLLRRLHGPPQAGRQKSSERTNVCFDAGGLESRHVLVTVVDAYDRPRVTAGREHDVH